MTGKSRRSKGKHHARSKKSKAKQRYTAVASQQQVAAPVASSVETAAPAQVPVPSARVRTAPSKPGKVRYPYITAELKRIGILAGIMLAILIVLALVLT